MKPNRPSVRIAVSFRLLAAAAIFAALGACQSIDTRPVDSPPTASKTGQTQTTPPTAAEPSGDRYVRIGYACCNLRHDGDWIGDSNQARLPFVPVGTPIRIRKIDGQHAEAEVDGKPMRFALDSGQQAESIEPWLNKIVVPDDPKARLAKFPARTRNAIAKGKLHKDMSREQVIMAVGYPQTAGNPKLDGTYWRYWWSSFGPYYVYWTKGGAVSKIRGDAETVDAVTYSGK
ncbi:MAG: hypothetical protein FWC58_10805 [Desulfobulbus sp.]|nr:hypothetical protein [Desulfobulbus sp.]